MEVIHASTLREDIRRLTAHADAGARIVNRHRPVAGSTLV
jgi:hypothetical protein